MDIPHSAKAQGEMVDVSACLNEVGGKPLLWLIESVVISRMLMTMSIIARFIPDHGTRRWYILSNANPAYPPKRFELPELDGGGHEMAFWAYKANATKELQEAINKSYETLDVEYRIVDVEVDDENMDRLQTHYLPRSDSAHGQH